MPKPCLPEPTPSLRDLLASGRRRSRPPAGGGTGAPVKRAVGRLALAFALAPAASAAGCAPSAPPPRPAAAARPDASKADSRASIARSDQYAQRLLAVLARFAPEGAQQLGLEGFDEAVF